ncbi:MAG: hypothetical protein Q9227_004327 [Pyrenula ochraceoflavens]
MVQNGTKDEMTLTVLGCGTLGIAILSGILASLSPSHHSTNDDERITSPSGAVTPNSSETPPRIPSRFVACVRRPESARRIEKALADYIDEFPTEILQNENLRGVRAADVVILAVKPQMVKDVLLADDDGASMRQALEGKLLVSICAGVTVAQIQDILYNGANPGDARIVRVMPNTAAIIRESTTVIATPSPPLSPALASLLTWLFSRIGLVVHLPSQHMDVSTALAGSGPAFLSLMLESLADGAVAMGLPRAEAQLMAAQTMRGTAGMVLKGEHPALVREKVSTPGGCTIGGLLVLEEGRVRGGIARGVREATVVASKLGEGAKGVNGTR